MQNQLFFILEFDVNSYFTEILQYLENISAFLYIRENNVVIMIVFAILHVLAIVLRVAVHLGYRSHNVVLNMDLSRHLTVLDDVKTIKSSLLRRVVSDYIIAARKNAARVPLAAIVDRQILSLSFWGWRYAGIKQWVDRLDNGLVLVGLILAVVFTEFAAIYGLLTAMGFVLLKITSAFFEFDSAKQMLVDDIILYVEREVGAFFAGHTTGALRELKEGLTASTDHQNKLFSETMEKINTNLAHLSELASINKAAETMAQSSDRYAVYHEAFIEQAKIIQQSQEAFEKGLLSYEETLKHLVQTMGDGMETFIHMHGNSAAKNLNETVSANITRISGSNQETLRAVTALVEQLNTQNRDISAHLRALHERIAEWTSAKL